MNMNKFNAEVVSSFERNGKSYIILEVNPLELPINREMNTRDKDFNLPNWTDFDFRVWLEGSRVFIVVTYKENELWRGNFDIPSSNCVNHDEIILGTLFGVQVYLRWSQICYSPEKQRVHLKSHLWLKYELLDQEIKTKIGEINKDFVV